MAVVPINQKTLCDQKLAFRQGTGISAFLTQFGYIRFKSKSNFGADLTSITS
jgi:hypothetical protein